MATARQTSKPQWPCELALGALAGLVLAGLLFAGIALVGVGIWAFSAHSTPAIVQDCKPWEPCTDRERALVVKSQLDCANERCRERLTEQADRLKASVQELEQKTRRLEQRLAEAPEPPGHARYPCDLNSRTQRACDRMQR